jgi:hypothetical protein
MATISGLNTFTAGTPAQASEVNTNFGIVKSFAEGLSTGANLDAGSVSQDKLGAQSVNSDKIQNLTIVDGDISTTAGIVDTKLATIATAGKVSNSATTATSANTANTIVARNASGDFDARVIRAVTVAGSTNRGIGIAADSGDGSSILQFTNHAGNAQLTSLVATSNLVTVTSPVTATAFNGPLNGNATSATTAANATAISNGTVTAAKLNGIYGLTRGDVGIVMTNSFADYTITIPNGRTYSDVVSVVPLVGTNSVVYIEGVGFGEQTFVLGVNQAIIRARLSNTIDAEPDIGYIRFWFAN